MFIMSPVVCKCGAVLLGGWMYVCATGRCYLCSVCVVEGASASLFVPVDLINQKLSDHETDVPAAITSF